MKVSFSLADIARHIGGELVGDGDKQIRGIATLESASHEHLSFLSNAKYKSALADTSAAAVIVNASDAQDCACAHIVCEDPYVAFAKAAQLLDNSPFPQREISAQASVHPSAKLGSNISIAAGAVIEADAVIGDDVTIGPNSVIGQGAVLGNNVRLHANVTLYHKVKLGARVAVHSGTVIGSDGFGYANDKGKWVKIPQTGTVVIGDDCEIGSNTSIDRGALDNTVIGNDVIIDNLVQIAHNVTIGDHCCICGGTGIAGSTNIGKYVVIAGTCVLNGHINVCDKVQITGFSMVTKSITEPGVYSSGMPVQTNKEWQRNTVRLRQLDKLAERIKQLEKLHK